MENINSIETLTSMFKVNDRWMETSNVISVIKEQKKYTLYNTDKPTEYIPVYRGFGSNGRLLFEVEANSSLVITYR